MMDDSRRGIGYSKRYFKYSLCVSMNLQDVNVVYKKTRCGNQEKKVKKLEWKSFSVKD